ncbi:MAG: DUF1829 domain-containing protein [Pirellulales bacterium]
MIQAECARLVDSYVEWLRSRVELRDVDGVCEITTPFLDRHNDRIQIYVHKVDGRLRLSDEGTTIADLELSGCGVTSPNRKRMLQTIVNGHGVQEKNGEMFVEAVAENFPHKKHSLLQAILEVNDMFMTAKHHVAAFFLEDVKGFLEEITARYSPDVAFLGKTGFTHHFDFVIPKSAGHPERIIKAINNPNKDAATSLLFSWTDTKETRPARSAMYAILNDTERRLNADVLTALEHYDVQTVPWTKRQEYAAKLAA